MRLCACVIDVLLTLLAASLMGARPASSVSAGKPNTQAPQLEAQFINQVVAKVEKLLMVGSGNTESLQYEVFEPHVDLRPATRKRRRKRRRRRRHLEEGSGGDSADLSLELPAFGQTLRLDLGQTEELISSQFQVVEEGASNNSSGRRRRRDVSFRRGPTGRLVLLPGPRARDRPEQGGAIRLFGPEGPGGASRRDLLRVPPSTPWPAAATGRASAPEPPIPRRRRTSWPGRTHTNTCDAATAREVHGRTTEHVLSELPAGDWKSRRRRNRARRRVGGTFAVRQQRRPQEKPQGRGARPW
ncbi:hypothetical protein MRX96_017705 [Rhipicephalus microplus]